MTRPFSFYDQRHHPTVDVPAGYERWAQTYDQEIGDHLAIDLLARLRAIQWTHLGPVVDLACGTGQIGSWLRRQGVGAVEGVDLSSAMLGHAQDRGAYRLLVQADISACPLDTGRYDLGVCSLATCHLPELEPFFQEAGRLLRPGGQLVIIDYHPFFLLNGIPTHFHDAQGGSIAIQNHVHLISDYVTLGRQRGWILEEMVERLVDEAWAAQAPNMAKYLGQPVSFAMTWRSDTRA